jgi:hypothetical protein
VEAAAGGWRLEAANWLVSELVRFSPPPHPPYKYHQPLHLAVTAPQVGGQCTHFMGMHACAHACSMPSALSCVHPHACRWLPSCTSPIKPWLD